MNAFSKIKILVISIILTCCPNLIGSSLATTLNYIMVSHNLYWNNAELENSTAIVRLEFYDHIREYIAGGYSSPDNPIVELTPGEYIPIGDYYYEVKNWSVAFYGDAAFLGQGSGTGGGFRWSISDFGLGPDWMDEWGFLTNGSNMSGQSPAFFWSDYNYLDPMANDYLGIKGKDLYTSLSFSTGIGEVGLSGDQRFSPVPEPASILLLGTGFLGLVACGRKKFAKK